VAGAVAHSYNSSSSGGGVRKDYSSRPACAKSSDGPISTNEKLAVVACACSPSYSESLHRKISVQADLSIKEK
jgi:hypothetical protein